MGGSMKMTALSVMLLMCFALRATDAQAGIVRTVVAKKFITSSVSRFGLGIEGMAVDQVGNVYAVGFAGDGTSGIGSVANARAQLEQNLLVKDQTASSSFNGLRFLPLSPSLSTNFDLRALAADVKSHSVVQFLRSKRDGRTRGSPFCQNSSMIQPNDIAVAVKSGRIYMTGGAYSNVNTVVGHGDLWMCEGRSSFTNTSRELDLEPVEAKLLGLFGLTNGIEVSPDEKTLYLTESFHKFGEPYSNFIWKFDIDQKTGLVENKTLLVDFQKLDGSGHVDLDGMRCDVHGNLFVTKNGMNGETVKISPTGELLLRIKLPGLYETTNVEFGGPDGKTLYMSGKCIDNPDLGCVDMWDGNPAPGAAWALSALHH